MVTAGPTYEAIDPVRFIGNHSSGKMGIAIAKELKNAEPKLHLILGPFIRKVTGGFKYMKVNVSRRNVQCLRENIPQADIAVMSAAVADYTPVDRCE